MSRKDYYFGSKYFRGLGKAFFLKVIQEAPEGSGNRKLLGSVVDEIDYGVFGSKEAPKPEHHFDHEIIIKKLIEHGLATRENVVEKQGLAALDYALSVKRERGADLSANFPGIPVEAGLDIDYTNLRRVEITFGSGTTRYYIRRGLLEKLYDKLDGEDRHIDSRMDDDKMIINSIIIAKHFVSNVSFNKEVGAEIEARAAALSNIGATLNFKKTSERSYKVEFNGDREYLIALTGLEWSRLDR